MAKEFVMTMRAVISIAKNASGLTVDDERIIAAAEAALTKLDFPADGGSEHG